MSMYYFPACGQRSLIPSSSCDNYALNCIVFLLKPWERAARWDIPYRYNPSETLGSATANEFGWRNHRVFVWVGVSQPSSDPPDELIKLQRTSYAGIHGAWCS